jgi:hypothetical protein
MQGGNVAFSMRNWIGLLKGSNIIFNSALKNNFPAINDDNNLSLL